MNSKVLFRAAVFTSFFALLFASMGIASSAPNKPDKPDKAKEAIAFWTADRINSAIPFEMVFEKGSKVAKRVPLLKGTGKPSKGGNLSTVIGASWNNNGLPLTASGKVFFAFGSSYYQCSGSLVRDGQAGLSIVLTAGHCIYDNGLARYADYWIFIPSYDVNQVSIDGCSNSNGCWPSESLFAHPGFTNENGFTSNATLHDWGFATIKTFKNGLLPDGGNGAQDGTNSFEISFSDLASSTQVSSFGYPAAGKYNGRDLVYSSGRISFDANNASATYSLASDMTGGCSGGPWLSNMQTIAPFSGTLSSVNSYKYGMTRFIYGPKFNSNTQVTYNLALGVG